jgi:hypothetical protein
MIIDSIFKVVTGIIKLRGATDNTLIGNVGDRLKVTSNSSPLASKKYRVLDLNASNGGVARETVITNTTWVDIYSCTGTGTFHSVRATLETGNDWRVRVLIDGTEEILLDSNGILTNDMTSDSIYDLDPSGKSSSELFDEVGLFMGAHDQFCFTGPTGLGIPYTTSIAIKVKRETGAATKKFKGGVITITKET